MSEPTNKKYYIHDLRDLLQLDKRQFDAFLADLDMYYGVMNDLYKELTKNNLDPKETIREFVWTDDGKNEGHIEITIKKDKV